MTTITDSITLSPVLSAPLLPVNHVKLNILKMCGVKGERERERGGGGVEGVRERKRGREREYLWSE